MLKSICCSICLSIDKRTINIYATNLQYVYEILANFKVRDTECWMCYICHTRLEQCHQLHQLATQTRGLISVLLHNKTDVKFGAFGCLVRLSTSTEIDSICDSTNIKQEPDMQMESCNNGLGDPLSDIPRLPDMAYHTIKLPALQEETVTPSQSADVKCLPVPQNLDDRGQHIMWTGPEIQIKIELEEIEERSDYKTEVNTSTEEQENIQSTNSDRYTCPKRHRCPFCSKEFKYPSFLKKHMDMHNDGPATCVICSEKFESKRSLNAHMGQVHVSQRSYGCQICSTKFFFEADYKRHVQSHGSRTPRRQAKTQERQNNRQEEFICSICSKKLSTRSSLRKHLLMHEDVRPYVCHYCGKKFRDKRCLRVHIRMHTTAKPFRCDICSEQFSNERYYNAHTRLHTSEKVFKCDICPKMFLERGKLTKHRNVHTGDKPYTCDLCSRSFTQKGSLRVHLHSHTGERKFSCHICSKKFLRNNTLQAHIKIHDRPQEKHGPILAVTGNGEQ